MKQLKQNTVLVMVLLNAFATPLMLSAVNVALPSVARDLDLDAVALSWVPTAYLMASAIFILIFGRLADLYGRRRIFTLGTAAVIVTSLLAALAWNAPILLGARFLQGVASAMLYATQIAIVSSVSPPNQRGRAIGLVVSAVYVGLAAGPLLGGLAIDALGWRLSFLLHVPLALVVLLLARVAAKSEAETKPAGASFDTTGALSYGAGILLFCLGAARVPATQGFLLLGAGTAAIGLFFRHARRTASPLWDVKLFFSNRVFTFSCTAALIMYSATYANVVLISLYLQYLKAISPSGAGLIMMVQPLSMALLSPLAGKLSDRIEPRLPASLGIALTAVGLAMLATLDHDASLYRIISALALTGLGFSLFSSPNANAIMGSVPPQNYGSGSGAIATVRVIGQLTSMVLVTLVLTVVVGTTTLDVENYANLEQAIQVSFTIAAVLCLPGVVLSLIRGRMHRPESSSRQSGEPSPGGGTV